MPDPTEFVDIGCEGWPAFRGTYIEFQPLDKLPGQSTWRWNVLAQEGGAYLGMVKWFGRWTKYTFTPDGNSVFESTCLREIADFIEQRTTDQRRAAAKKRKRK